MEGVFGVCICCAFVKLMDLFILLYFCVKQMLNKNNKHANMLIGGASKAPTQPVKGAARRAIESTSIL